MSNNPKRGGAVGSHHSAASKTNNWFTPRKVTDPLGPFDTDPATSVNRPWDIARVNLTRRDGALAREWGEFGRVWLNPPYALRWIVRFLDRLASHGNGVALVFARTETQWFVRSIAQRAHGLLFIAGRLHFCRQSGCAAAFNAGAPSVLVAYGTDNLDVLAAAQVHADYDDGNSVIWPAGRIPGSFVPLIVPRSVLALFVGTWREAIEATFPRGDFGLDDLYQAFAAHPKARTNAHVKEKLRQTLARGGFERVGPGRYRVAA